jgi:hypothetical protein
MASARTVRDQIGVTLEPPEQPPQPQQQPDPEPDRPEWLPEKFTSPAEFADSYRSLQEELRTRGEAQKGLEREINDLRELIQNFTPQEPQQQPGQQAAYQEQLMSAYEQDPLGTVVFLAGQAAAEQYKQMMSTQQPQLDTQQAMQGEIIAATASRLMEARYPDWSNYEQKVGEAIEANPLLLTDGELTSLDRTAEALDRVYKLVKYDDLVAGNGAPAPPGDQSAAMKRQAQTMQGAAGRPGPESETDEKIARLIAAHHRSSWSGLRAGS